MFPSVGRGEREAIRSRSSVVWAVAVAIFMAIMLTDILSPPEVEFSAFYLLPIFWVAWFRGTREGLLMALVAGIGWYVHDRLSGRPMSSELYRLWDGLNKQACYLLAAWVVGALRRQVQGQLALNRQLSEALAEVKELKGLLPVCAWCHKIRDEEGAWQPMEVFLQERTRAEATHGICPECLAKEHNLAAGAD